MKLRTKDFKDSTDKKIHNKTRYTGMENKSGLEKKLQKLPLSQNLSIASNLRTIILKRRRSFLFSWFKLVEIRREIEYSCVGQIARLLTPDAGMMRVVR